MPKNNLADKEFINAIDEFQSKYEKLVWFARSHPITDEEYWDKVPHDIREGALNAQAAVIKDFPKEVEALCHHEGGDWSHGFNSGCLAAFRFVLTALDNEWHQDPDTNELWCEGGLETALEEFPAIDT